MSAYGVGNAFEKAVTHQRGGRVRGDYNARDYGTDDAKLDECRKYVAKIRRRTSRV